MYKSLKFLKETSIDNDDIFEEYFVTALPDGEEIELVPGGKEMKITDNNKEEYIKLM